MLGRSGILMAGQFAAWSAEDKASTLSLSANLLTVTKASGAADGNIRGTLGKTVGKWKFEATLNAKSVVDYPNIGLANLSASLTAALGGDSNSIIYVPNTANVIFQGANQGAGADTYTTGNTISVEYDGDNHQVNLQKAGSANRYTFGIAALTGPVFPVAGLKPTGDQWTINFGDSAFSVAPTAGFSAWCF